MNRQNVVSGLLVFVSMTMFLLINPATSFAAYPQTFYAHTENRGYEASDNQMDQRTPEPNTGLYSITPTVGGAPIQMPGNNTAGGRYFTGAWPSAGTIAAGTWTFHTWIWKSGSGIGAYTYYVQVFKNADVTPIFTTGTRNLPNVASELDVTGSAPSISMSAGDRLRFEYWVNIPASPGRTLWIRIDDIAAPDNSTRVDTTIAQIVPTLGFWLLSAAVIFFIFFAVRKGILTPQLRGVKI